MHELSIAMSILEAAKRETDLHSGAELRRICVRIGELAAVDPEALRFSFEAITRETDCEGVQLELEAISRANRCSDCAEEFVVTNGEFLCPRCGSANTSFVRGDELEIVALELEAEEG